MLSLVIDVTAMDWENSKAPQDSECEREATERGGRELWTGECVDERVLS